MSLVTIVDMGDKVSVMSDGLGVDHKTLVPVRHNFQKYLIKNDFVVTATGSGTVAEHIFEEFSAKNYNHDEAKQLLDASYRKITNHDFTIVLITKYQDIFRYNVYIHLNGKHEAHNDFHLPGGNAIVSHSNAASMQSVNQFKESIKALIASDHPTPGIVEKQREFHLSVAQIDDSVNNVLFHDLVV